MPTSKQPKFPNPPLEVGVAQYPTPFVPDYYTKDGHIILVEKVSIEKGSYNPQPLDGTITYTARDANKWPSTLYLVFQRPEETGQFVYNYWANDRTLASQDPWNYGVSYSTENPDFPIYTRTYITPRSQYVPVALGSVDPFFGGTAIIAKQQMAELGDDNPLRSRYVQVQRVYESIPSAVISGKKLDDRGDIETITTQVVVAGTAPTADGLFVTRTAVEPVDSVKSTKTYGYVESYATLTTKVKKSGLLGEASVTDDIVSPTTTPDALSITILESSVEAISATKSRKKTTESSGPTSLTGVATKSGLLGLTSTEESIVAYGSDADALSTTVIQSEVTPIDAYKSKKATITASGPTELDGKSLQEFGIATTKEKIVAYGASPTIDATTIKSDIQPIDSAKSKLVQIDYADTDTVITSYQYDEFFDTNLKITRQIVPTETAALSHTNGILSYKDEAIDPYKKQRTIVSTSALPPTRTEYFTGTFQSPLLVFDITADSEQVFCTAERRVKLTPVTRSSQSRQTIFKSTTSYSYGRPSLVDSGLLAPELREVAFTGYVINFNLGGALCDHLVAPDNFAAGLGILINQCFIGMSLISSHYEKWDIAATSPSATTYLGYIGTYKKTSWETKYWKAGIWQTKEIQTLIV